MYNVSLNSMFICVAITQQGASNRIKEYAAVHLHSKGQVAAYQGRHNAQQADSLIEYFEEHYSLKGVSYVFECRAV